MCEIQKMYFYTWSQFDAKFETLMQVVQAGFEIFVL